DGEPSCQDNGLYSTRIIRIQRVAHDGSLKLDAELPTFLNPEPRSLAIWTLCAGAGTLLALLRKKRNAATA
ncbi:MAG: hypothetical protein WEH44_01910, partial [Pirellulaceae bacterium]